MENRLLFAYSLIALLLVGFTVLLAMVIRKRRTPPPADVPRPVRAQPAQAVAVPRRERLQMLEVGRGLAALAVVLFHINEFFRRGRFGAPENLFTPFAGGYAGVQLFFVLSGFLMGICMDATLVSRARLARSWPSGCGASIPCIGP